METKRLDELKSIIAELRKFNHTKQELIPGVYPEYIANLLEESQMEVIQLREELIKNNIDVIDRKFQFLALNPCTGNFYTQKDAFIMCAKDRAVPAALETYIDECIKLNADENQIKSAQLLLKRVLEFQSKFPTKVPDVSTSREIFTCCQDE